MAQVFTGGSTAERTADGLVRLIAGNLYSYTDLEFAGWYVGDERAHDTDGYAVEHYFGTQGAVAECAPGTGYYLGPDPDGIEPLFR